MEQGLEDVCMVIFMWSRPVTLTSNCRSLVLVLYWVFVKLLSHFSVEWCVSLTSFFSL